MFTIKPHPGILLAFGGIFLIKRFSIVLLFFLLYTAIPAHAMDVTLQWNNSTEPDIIGYKVYYSKGMTAYPFNGTDADQGPSPINITAGNSLVLTGLSPTAHYYFTLTAYNAQGESGPAKILSINPSGDVNSDGIVNIYDAYVALQIALNKIEYSGANLAQGDVAPLLNGMSEPDGVLDAGDVLILLRKVAGEIP